MFILNVILFRLPTMNCVPDLSAKPLSDAPERQRRYLRRWHFSVCPPLLISPDRPYLPMEVSVSDLWSVVSHSLIIIAYMVEINNIVPSPYEGTWI
ncbi:hypothetical protein QJS04_geneDACA024893 [Acorus gramineus]|uniref:Uncharacterized protein n=1 Tax=Acorus gramineus TaxID=55184 RepID=A0AAV9A0D9_ACOGR|nr:hypothetical protein QJS04_geneDACA024893 [Acorus gramineus]